MDPWTALEAQYNCLVIGMLSSVSLEPSLITRQ